MAQVTQDYEYGYRAKRSRSASGVRVERSVPKAKYRRPAAKYRRKVPPTVRAYVKSAITRSLEVKKTFITANQIAYKPQITTGSLQNLIPGVVQGAGQASRVGNSIGIKKAMIRGVINGFALGSGAGPTYVDLYITKSIQSNTVLTMVDFLQVGSTSVDYDGDARPYSGLLRVNEDAFKPCIHERFMVFNPANTTTVAYAAAINPSVTFVYDITAFIKKTLVFNDTSSLPTNDSLYLCIGSTQADGGSLAGGNAGEVTWVVEIDYTDA